MKICSNCGATNREEKGSICRKCGALLPVARSSRRRRIEMPSNEDDEIKILSSQTITPDNKNQFENNNQIALNNNPETKFFHSQDKSREGQFDLQKIPHSDEISIDPMENELMQNITSEVGFSSQEILTSERPKVKQLSSENGISLPEIKPQPYQGSILSSTPSIIKSKSKPSSIKSHPPIPTVKPLPKAISSVEVETKQMDQVSIHPINETLTNGNGAKFSIKKQKLLDLEQDMVEVLKFLSKKLSLPKNEIKIIKKGENEKEIEETIHPSSLNEILKSLVTMNRHIEAATLLKKDGTILAAAISTRISDSLLATIGQNLAMIGTDIVHGLSAGALQSISIRGTEGILDVAPLNQSSPLLKDMLLMIFSNPKISSGVIFFAVKQIEKLIIDFFNGK